MKFVYKKIADERIRQSLSLRKLGKLANVKDMTVRRVERGESSPTVRVLCGLCEALKLDPASLFSSDE